VFLVCVDCVFIVPALEALLVQTIPCGVPLFAAEEAGLGEFLIDAVSGVMADATAVPARYL
jgi:hypothetical protein